jgi:hypothetical protein
MTKALVFVVVFVVLTVVVGESVHGLAQKRTRAAAKNMSVLKFQAGTTTWKNLRGSVMVLINDGNGNLTGEYTTAVGCKEVVGKPQKLTGTINGSAITWTVNWGAKCRSLTSWVGEMETPTTINSLWLLGLNPENPRDFKAIYAGSDFFTLQH